MTWINVLRKLLKDYFILKMARSLIKDPFSLMVKVPEARG